MNFKINKEPEFFSNEKNEESFNFLLGTLEKSDIDFLKRSLVNFNIKESSTKKYNVKFLRLLRGDFLSE